MALSSCEVEYITIIAATCKGIWLVQLISELKGEDAKVAKLRVDNKSPIALSKNPIFHNQSKHIDIMYDFIRKRCK